MIELPKTDAGEVKPVEDWSTEEKIAVAKELLADVQGSDVSQDSDKRDHAIKEAMAADPALTYTTADEKLFGGAGPRLI